MIQLSELDDYNLHSGSSSPTEYFNYNKNKSPIRCARYRGMVWSHSILNSIFQYMNYSEMSSEGDRWSKFELLSDLDIPHYWPLVVVTGVPASLCHVPASLCHGNITVFRCQTHNFLRTERPRNMWDFYLRLNLKYLNN